MSEYPHRIVMVPITYTAKVFFAAKEISNIFTTSKFSSLSAKNMTLRYVHVSNYYSQAPFAPPYPQYQA
jgi:hypothetical protein